MGSFVKNIKRILTAAVVIPGLAFAAQAPNPRSTTNSMKNVIRGTNADPNVSVRRSATSVIARSVAANGRKNAPVVRARSVISRTPNNIPVRSVANFVSNNTRLSRSATSKPNTIVRGTIKQSDAQTNKVGLSRAAKSRATAVFDDVTKIGGGYSSCRDAYATCMDQFCAIADDTYRRCYCSDKFAILRDTSDNINTALGLLVDFQNNNLNAINKTAAEVNAMYSSTAGEMAIKKDTSASQKMLDEIGDILSGKKTKKASSSNSSSLGIIDFGGLSDTGDIWSSGSSTAFNSRASDGMSGLEGRALYKRASSQCASIMGANCPSDTMFNLASSAYSIMVTQDCNILEKTVNAKKENLMQTVRKAEQILREARLEEYRAHNSQDVNECLNKVEAAMTEPLVCGPNYEKCLDYTGLYINATTGEPIPHQLFDLNKIAPVLGDIDVLESNPRWNDFLDSKRKFVVPALDTCRNLADDVWLEYKRSAMVRIAQMQDAKIEQFKNSCVQTIKECYNTNDDTLKDLTDGVLEDTAYDVGATRAVTVRNMCYQDVLACAAMYGDVDGCQYDSNTRKITARKGAGKCGLSALLAYVDSVDTARVAQGCESTLVAKTHDMCDPLTYTTTTTTTTSSRAAKSGRAVFMNPSIGGGFVGKSEIDTEAIAGGIAAANSVVEHMSATFPITAATTTTITEKYPAGCKDWQLGKILDELQNHAIDFCATDLVENDTANVNYSESTLNIEIINSTIHSVYERLCMDLGYDSKTCHGTYGTPITEEKIKEKQKTTETQKTSKDPIDKLNEKYQEDVVYQQQAGFDKAGGAKADAYFRDNLTDAQMAQMYVTAGGDVRDQVANFYEQGNPYAYGISGDGTQMLIGGNGTFMDAGGGTHMGVSGMATGITNSAIGAAVPGVSNAMTQQNYGH